MREYKGEGSFRSLRRIAYPEDFVVIDQLPRVLLGAGSHLEEAFVIHCEIERLKELLIVLTWMLLVLCRMSGTGRF